MVVMMMVMMMMPIIMIVMSTTLSQNASFNHVAVDSDDFRLVALCEAHCIFQISLV